MKSHPQKRIVWDTGPLSLFFAGHSEAAQGMEQIKDGKTIGYIPQLVLIELFYKTWQKFGKQTAQVRVLNLDFPGIVILVIQESERFKIGSLKVQYPQLSLVDCRVAQLGLQLNGMVYTTENGITEVAKLRTKKLIF